MMPIDLRFLCTDINIFGLSMYTLYFTLVFMCSSHSCVYTWECVEEGREQKTNAIYKQYVFFKRFKLF